MAALGDERLFELLEADGPAIARGRSGGVRVAAPSPRSSSAPPGPRSRSSSPTSASARASGGRITLNLGHSLGHAVEAAAGYGDLLHGEAVAYGLRAAARIGAEAGVTPPERAERIDAAPRPPRPGDRAAPLLARGRPGATSRPTRSTPAAGCAGSCRRPTASSSATTSSPAVVERAASSPAGGRRERRDDDASSSSRARTSTWSGRASRRSTGTSRSTRSTPGSRRAPPSSAWRSTFFQSNHEGALIDRLHQRDFDVAIVNAGGLTHTSVSLRDALLARPAAVRRGPPVRPVEARAVPAGQLPPRHRARVDRRAGRPRLPPRARVDRRGGSGAPVR